MTEKNNGFHFDNSYLALNEIMYTTIDGTNTYNSKIELINNQLAQELGIHIDYIKSKDGLNLFSGNQGTEYKNMYAQAYSGHQFGYLNKLGDGRALMIGEHLTKEGNRFDLQLKGSGRTPYSRGGDGKATLYSMLREYIISEAIHFLHIPTTRSLVVLSTDESVRRMEMNKGAILTRTAKSHIRVGTFSYALQYGGKNVVKELTDYTIARHYSHLIDNPQKYLLFVREVLKNQASLIAKWQSVGFVHGVMNTDNVLVSGETIDYGPCAFMNQYNPKTVFSSIDSNGRYAYGNQPYMTSWNLARFIETVMHLLDEDSDIALQKANQEISSFEDMYNKQWILQMSQKIGIKEPKKTDKKLIQELLDLMEAHKEDFTNTFRFLTVGDFSSIGMIDHTPFENWILKWKKRLQSVHVSMEQAQAVMKKNNPYVIPRNNVIEEALIQASKYNDYSLFNEFLTVLRTPFDYQRVYQDEFVKNPIDNHDYVTFCGT
jgi:uncharacterized protein YdiU (UPF0061 family)